MMTRALPHKLTLFLVLAALIFGSVFADARLNAIGAQEIIQVAQAEKKRSLFDILFGRNKSAKEKAQETKRAPTQSKKSTSRRTTSSPSITTVPKIQMIEKSPDAQTLMVVGDSLAIDLAKGLDRFYAKDTDLAILSKGVGSSGFVRDDYFDWQAAIEKFIAEEDFDLVVVAIGINDRQQIRAADGRHEPLSDGWKAEYERRLNAFLGALSAANKPVIWLELPPMSKSSYSKAMSQISSLHRLAAYANGAEFVDIYDRFVDAESNYTSYGPDLNGNQVTMRKSDGIHFSTAGSDKVAFFVDKAVKLFYRGGQISVAVADMLEGSDLAALQRPPFQGIAQIRKIELAGEIIDLSLKPKASGELVVALETRQPVIELDKLFDAPRGRVDAFGVGIVEQEADDENIE
jgi:hypothetical protein